LVMVTPVTVAPLSTPVGVCAATPLAAAARMPIVSTLMTRNGTCVSGFNG
jgi:hypothetical protein